MSDPLPPHAEPTVSLSNEAEVRKILQSSVSSLWDAVNELTRLRPTKRERFNVSIFGSARIEPGDRLYHEVKHMAHGLADLNCGIITGGGPGLMQAANEGASLADDCKVDCSVGIRVQLPFEQVANPFVQAQYEHKTFFTRLHHFVVMSDAFVVVPGGIGSVLEAMTIWQLLQVGHLKGAPLIFVGQMWEELVEWARKNMLDEQLQLASAKDMDIPFCASSAREVIDIIKQAQSRWSSQPTTPDSKE